MVIVSRLFIPSQNERWQDPRQQSSSRHRKRPRRTTMFPSDCRFLHNDYHYSNRYPWERMSRPRESRPPNLSLSLVCAFLRSEGYCTSLDNITTGAARRALAGQFCLLCHSESLIQGSLKPCFQPLGSDYFLTMLRRVCRTLARGVLSARFCSVVKACAALMTIGGNRVLVEQAGQKGRTPKPRCCIPSCLIDLCPMTLRRKREIISSDFRRASIKTAPLTGAT